MDESGSERLLLARLGPAPAGTTPTIDTGETTVGAHAIGAQADETRGKRTAPLGGQLRRIALALLALCAVLAAELPTPALAATRTWTGAGPDNNWTTASNWIGNSAPVVGDDLVFPDGVTKTTAINTFAAGTAFRSIVFTGSRYTIGGNRFALTNGIQALNPSLGNTIGVPVDLRADQTFTIESPGASVTLTAGVDTGDVATGSGAGTPRNLTLAGAGTHDIGVLLGTGTVTKADSGTAIVHDDSPGSIGNVVVDGGILRLFSAKPLVGTASRITVNDGGAIEIQLSGAQTFRTRLTLFGNGPSGAGDWSTFRATRRFSARLTWAPRAPGSAWWPAARRSSAQTSGRPAAAPRSQA